jgi:hypothetical protein
MKTWKLKMYKAGKLEAHPTSVSASTSAVSEGEDDVLTGWRRNTSPPAAG